MSNDAGSVLDVARGELGYSRWDDPEQGTKYGRWYAEQTGEGWYGENGVAYCAMFVSWVFAQAGATCAGVPGAYTPYMVDAARQAGAVVDASSAQPGDVVYFDWDGGVVDHVGIVEENNGSYLTTLEGNTLNGRVARRTRAWAVIADIVRPSYGSGEVSAPATEPGPEPDKLEVDGLWGEATTLKLQQVLGCPYTDGQISRQNAAWRGICPGCTSGWEWVDGGIDPGSQTISAVQERIGAGVDGFIGPDTINALIAYEMGHGSGATECDGCLDESSLTIKQMQRDLNNGFF